MSPAEHNLDKLTDDEVAAKKFLQYKSKDPFPKIAPALLNSADIHDYILTAGMICPYEPEKKLKSASYEVHFCEGEIVFWDDNHIKQVHTYRDKEDTYILKKNSIVYVSLTTKLRLPDYIALRFNLRINLVHKGLLLGTGPLVDPGFEGNLLIPLHNMTANDHKLKGGEGFIWVEFTKISFNMRWENHEECERSGVYTPFPESKKNQSREYYFNEALRDSTPFDIIRSSIPGEVQKAIDIASATDSSVKKIKKFGWVSLISIAVALILALIPIVQLVLNSVNYVKGARGEVQKELLELKELKSEINTNLIEIKQIVEAEKKKKSKEEEAKKRKRVEAN